MNINPLFFSHFWLITGALAYAGVLLLALRAAPWWRLKNPDDLNVLLYAILGVFFLWVLNADIPARQSLTELNFHLLGATLMTLMFGWAFAILAMSVALTTVTLMTSHGDISSLLTLPWEALATSVVPVLISYRLFRLVDRRLPNHFFIYIFICAFFGAALSMAGAIITTSGIHYLSGSLSVTRLTDTYLPYGLILMLPEAFINGMLMTVFVAYRPEWVSTFDDQRYLKGH